MRVVICGGGVIGACTAYFLTQRGIHVTVGDGLTIELDLVVGHGLPVAEVARQVDSAVRYEIRQALGRDVERLTIHVGGLRVVPFDAVAGRSPANGRRKDAIAPDDLAASGTDVA